MALGTWGALAPFGPGLGASVSVIRWLETSVARLTAAKRLPPSCSLEQEGKRATCPQRLSFLCAAMASHLHGGVQVGWAWGLTAQALP